MPEINYLAVLVAAIASMVLGFIWYGPLFGKLWMDYLKKQVPDPAEQEAMKKGMAGLYIQQFIASLILAYVFAHVLWAFSIAMPVSDDVMSELFMAGAQGGFWMWVGFVLPIKWGDKLWGGKKFQVLSVELGYHLVTLMIMGIILSFWK